MRKKTCLPAVFVLVALMGMTHSARADGCRAQEEQTAAVQMKAAEDLERAGKLKPAYQAAEKIDAMCLAGGGSKRHEALRQRLGLQLGQQEEGQGRLAAAFDWYKATRNEGEADRVLMMHVNAKPGDRNLLGRAIDHFRFRNNPARVAELRQLAAKNAELELAKEEKAFAARKDSLQELDHARDWLYYVGDGAIKKVQQRAEMRGDALAREDTLRHLENAKRYFFMAEAKSKESALKDKALRLAQAHEKKGEISQARDFYSLAGADAHGQAMQERAEAQHQKAEGKRQKQFKKGQDDLEKELGL